jgi:hypothetical protein
MTLHLRILCLFLFSVVLLFFIEGCTLIELPFVVTGEVIGTTGEIVAEVGEAL